MDNGEHPGSAKQDSPKDVPSLFKYIDSNAVAGFDNVGGIGTVKYHRQPTWAASSSYYSPDHSSAKATGTTALYNQADAHGGSISISMPTTPLGLKRAPVSGYDGQQPSNYISNPPMQSVVPNLNLPKPSQFRSQPIASGPAYAEAVLKGGFPDSPVQNLVNPRMNRLKDKRFDSFKTWSGKLERQISQLRGKPQEPKPDIPVPPNPAVQTLPVDRYFDALEGPELETLRVSEELVLPEDKLWPFLLRFPISSFGICLGVSSQAILWKTIAESPSTNFLHVSMDVNLILWCISVALMVIVPVIYSLKVVFFFEAVRREYYHPIRVNFFFAPWIALLFLAIGLPPSLAKSLPPALWYVLMTPFLLLELKIYGQWMSGGQRRLSKVANPSNHLSIVGNFVGSLLGASMGLKEGPILFFAIGLAHYIVLFVTLYQRLPTNETLPKELHPVFFLFVAAPSVASMAWAKIQGSFDTGSKLSYFIALFLYFSLAVRVNFFRGFKFSLAWWAYTFPMTGAAIATIRYANVVKNPVTQTLSVILSSTSTLTVTALLVSTIIHAFVLRDLFPNDIAIAISQRRPRSIKKRFNLATASSDTKDLESSLRTTSSNTKELEASLQNAASKF